MVEKLPERESKICEALGVNALQTEEDKDRVACLVTECPYYSAREILFTQKDMKYYNCPGNGYKQ